MKHSQGFIGAAALVTGAALLTSCAQGFQQSDADDVAYDASAELPAEQVSVMGFGDPDEIGTTRWDMAAEAIQPATIASDGGSFDIQAFLSANSAGTSPDLIYVNRDNVGSLASLGAITSLQSCVEGEQIAVDELSESAVKQVTFDGEIYGIPEFNSVQLTMANTDLLDEAGLTVEDVNGTSWDAITSAAEKMSVVEGGQLKVIGYDPKIPEFFPLWVKANGADLISEDGKTANINDPKAVEALEFAMNILDGEGGWAKVKSLRDAADFFGEGNQFATGELGAMNMEQWYTNVLNNVTPDVPISITPFISQATGEPIAMATGSAWAIPSRAEHKQAACRFIGKIVAEDAWLKAAEARVSIREEEGKPFTGLLTGNSVADQSIREQYVKPTGSDVWDEAIDSMYVANDNLFYMPANPADEEFRQAWMDAVNRVLAGEMSAQESLDKGQEAGQAALDKAWTKRNG